MLKAIKQMCYSRPTDLLIYYGWLNAFNSAVNGWDNQKVALDLARYGLLVFGDGLQQPSHGDYANTKIILTRLKQLNPDARIFGYVACNQASSDFKVKTDLWNALSVHGILMDCAGYDYGTLRKDFNIRVNYVHGQDSANKVFANAWNPDHILGLANDAAYPNSTYNCELVPSRLAPTDWILLESFPINTVAYANGYEPQTDWIARGSKMLALRRAYAVQFAGCGIIADGHTSELDLFKFGFISALMFSLDAFGTSDTNYGAGSAKAKFISRPDTTAMGLIYSQNDSVQQDTVDTDVYRRFTEHSKLTLDFSTGAQLSEIVKF